jgi:hypothetical protein
MSPLPLICLSFINFSQINTLASWLIFWWLCTISAPKHIPYSVDCLLKYASDLSLNSFTTFKIWLTMCTTSCSDSCFHNLLVYAPSALNYLEYSKKGTVVYQVQEYLYEFLTVLYIIVSFLLLYSGYIQNNELVSISILYLGGEVVMNHRKIQSLHLRLMVWLLYFCL